MEVELFALSYLCYEKNEESAFSLCLLKLMLDKIIPLSHVKSVEFYLSRQSKSIYILSFQFLTFFLNTGLNHIQAN